MSEPKAIAPEQPFRTYHMKYKFDGLTFSPDASVVSEQRAYDACSAWP